jgi:hypothetical protein
VVLLALALERSPEVFHKWNDFNDDPSARC